MHVYCLQNSKRVFLLEFEFSFASRGSGTCLVLPLEHVNISEVIAMRFMFKKTLAMGCRRRHPTCRDNRFNTFAFH